MRTRRLAREGTPWAKDTNRATNQDIVDTHANSEGRTSYNLRALSPCKPSRTTHCARRLNARRPFRAAHLTHRACGASFLPPHHHHSDRSSYNPNLDDYCYAALPNRHDRASCRFCLCGHSRAHRTRQYHPRLELSRPQSVLMPPKTGSQRLPPGSKITLGTPSKPRATCIQTCRWTCRWT